MRSLNTNKEDLNMKNWNDKKKLTKEDVVYRGLYYDKAYTYYSCFGSSERYIDGAETIWQSIRTTASVVRVVNR
jgi:hypothetical protein